MKPKQIYQLVSLAVDHAKETPPMLIEGPPGIGKSAVPFEVCQDKGKNFVDIRLVQRDPSEFRVPVPNMQTKKAEWFISEELPTDHIGGIIALDELTSAPPLVQAMAYQLVFDRQLAEYHVPDEYYIMGMGNRLEDRAVVHKLSTALCNRFFHIEFDVDIDQWIDWALSVGIDPNIIGFLKWRPELLHKFSADSQEKAFASPRTWDFTDRLLKIVPKPLRAEVLEGTLGKGAAAEYMAFLKVQTELPDLDTIFGGDNFVPHRMDLRYALVSALASRAKANQFNRMLEYSGHLPAEFSVLLISMLQSRDEKALVLAPLWIDWVKANSDVVARRKML